MGIMKKLQIVLTIIFFLGILFSLPMVCGHDHEGHSHEHDDTIEEPASFKWSKEANEAYNKEPDSHEMNPPPSGEKKNDNIWLEAMGSTLLISIAPYLILFVIPVSNSKEHEPYLKILLAFASGGLLGDAFLHLIPHALMAPSSNEDNQHSHSHGSDGDSKHSHGNGTMVGVYVLCGVITFLVVEKLVRIFKGGHSHSHKVENQKSSDSKKNSKNKSKSKNAAIQGSKNSEMKVAGYLNLAADFTHNFTDGLAIGASFLAGRSVGIVTTFTIFLHEIPHEIGDFAILLQSGCTRKKAMCLQLITAVGALSGTCISLMAQGSGDLDVAWVLPFTAGGFIYIATVSVIPELLENCHFWQSVAEVVALLVGVGMMLAITWIEEMGHV